MLKWGLRESVLDDFLGSFEETNSGIIGARQTLTVRQNILKGIKWTLVFRETRFWFTGKLICINKVITGMLRNIYSPRTAAHMGEKQGYRGPGKNIGLLNFRGHRKQPPAAQRPPQQAVEALWFLWAPRPGPLYSLARKRGKASCTGRPTHAQLESLSQGESGARIQSPSPAHPPHLSLKYNRARG